MRVLDNDESHIISLLGEMADLTDQAMKQTLSCINNFQPELAQSVIENDQVINDLHQRIENECFTVTALQQPVASDLRDLFTDVYISIELERIADLSADIAGILLQMEEHIPSPFREPVIELGMHCRHMLAEVMQACRDRDVDGARRVAAMDDELDINEKQLIEDILKYMPQHAEATRHLSQTMWIAHCMERIGDRCTNIAERIVFMVTGNTVELN